MKRCYLFSACVVAVVVFVAAGGKVTVTNPFTADVDGNGYSLFGLFNLSAQHVSVTNSANAVSVGLDTMDGTDPHGATTVPSARGRVLLGDGGYPFFGYPSITAGTFDPSVQGVDLDAGSLFLRRVNASTGELWFKFGPNPTDWQLK